MATEADKKAAAADKAEEAAEKKRAAAEEALQAARENKSYDIEGVSVSVGDIIEIQKVPQQNQDQVHTTKGTFSSSLVPQELVEAYHAKLEAEQAAAAE